MSRLALSRVSAPFRAERLLQHNIVLGLGTVLAGLLGVAFQSLVSHRLHAADYGSVFAVVTVITFIGLPPTAFTLLMARETSRGRATGHEAPSATLLRKGNYYLLLSGIALAAAIVALSQPLTALIGVPGELWAAAAIGLPFSTALPLLLGEFQGAQRFFEMSALLIGQAGLKLVAALAFGAVVGPIGVIAGISLGSLGTYLAANRLLRRKLAIRPNLPWIRPAASYLAVILPSTIALSVLLSADVLLVKHYFPSNASGGYSAVAAIGRAIFWGASAVATVLFPKLAFRIALGQGGVHLVFASLLLVVVGGVGGFAVLFLSSNAVITWFAGASYAASSGYLALYAVAMTLLGGVAVLTATHQSSGKATFLWVLLPLTTAEPLLIVLFHQTLTQVIMVLTVSVAATFSGLATLFLVQNRTQAATQTNVDRPSAYASIRVDR